MIQPYQCCCRILSNISVTRLRNDYQCLVNAKKRKPTQQFSLVFFFLHHLPGMFSRKKLSYQAKLNVSHSFPLNLFPTADYPFQKDRQQKKWEQNFSSRRLKICRSHAWKSRSHWKIHPRGGIRVWGAPHGSRDTGSIGGGVEASIIHSSREIDGVEYVFLGGEDEGTVILSPGTLFMRARRAAWSN